MQIPAPIVITVISFIGVSATVFTIGWRVGKNGSKAHGKIYEEIKGKVEVTECHRAQDAIGKKIDDTRNHLSEKIDMTIDLLKKNGET